MNTSLRVLATALVLLMAAGCNRQGPEVPGGVDDNTSVDEHGDGGESGGGAAVGGAPRGGGAAHARRALGGH